MAKKIVVDAVAAQLGMNGVIAVEGNKFGMNVRNMDFGDALGVNDVIEIPEDFTVLQAPIQNSDRVAMFIMASVVAANGQERATRWYPNQLAKVAFPIDENGKHLQKVKTTGTAAAKWQEFQDVDAAMEWFKGKKIKVTGENRYKVHNRFTDQDEETRILSYDLVD